MAAFLHSIRMSFLFFPLVALFFTLPYVIWMYHKYGSVNFYRSVLVYSFLLYLLSSYFLVILPLPKMEYVESLTRPFYNLIPFHFISEILNISTFHVSDFASYFPTLKNPVVYEAIFNIFLTVPFGMYLHYYFRCNFKQTLGYSFCFSLFFELTQLTGLYFIYPRGYRVFDIDDLILNTFGGVVGYVLGFVCQKILPSKKYIDEKSYEKGKSVSLVRRTLSMIIDLTLISILYLGILWTIRDTVLFSKIFAAVLFILLFVIYFVWIPLKKNKTVGMSILKLEFTSSFSKRWYRYLGYYFCFFLEYIFFPLFLLLCLLYFKSQMDVMLWEYGMIILGATYLFILIISMLKQIFHVEMFNEWFTKLYIKSSIISL